MSGLAVLVVLGLVVAGLLSVPRRRGPRQGVPALRSGAPSARHFHYCQDCDHQWPHTGEGVACREAWALACPTRQAARLSTGLAPPR